MSYLFEGKQRLLNDFYCSEGHENNNDDDDVDENIIDNNRWMCDHPN